MSAEQVVELLHQANGALASGAPGRARTALLGAVRALLTLARAAGDEGRRRHLEQASWVLSHLRRVQSGEEPQAPCLPGGMGPVPPGGEGGFAEVAGMEEVKELLRRKYLYPLGNPSAAARYGRDVTDGILFFGPPGTGKTHIVRAFAAELDAPIFVVRPSDVLSRYVGESESRIAELFEEAERHPAAVIFVDELEALLPERHGGRNNHQNASVTEFLSALDGFRRRRNRLIFVGASNNPWLIDPAVLRPGRLGERVYVGLPDLETRAAVLGHVARGLPLARGLDPGDFARSTEGLSVADLTRLVYKAVEYPYVELVETGRERPVRAADFERALAEVRPSVSPELLARYEVFRHSFGD